MVKKRSRNIMLFALAIAIILIVAYVAYATLGSQGDAVIASGVKAGDEFIYNIQGFWSSQDPDAVMSESFLQLNMTEWFKVTVTGVSGSEVSINTTWRFTNGTELEASNNINVETGMTFPSDTYYAIYAAGLKSTDFVRPHGPDRSTVNATSNRLYASGSRETNRVSLVQESYDANNPDRTWTENTNIYFDKQTGILVELRDVNIYTNPQITLTTLQTLKETNVWNVS
jgi:hypothetical protein